MTTAAVQIAKHLGGIVAVASRSMAKAERTRALGADDVLAFDETRPLDKVLWEWSGKRASTSFLIPSELRQYLAHCER